MFDEKENSTPQLLGSFPIKGVQKAESKSQGEKRKGGAFGRLLKDVTNSTRVEEDEKIAHRTQTAEAQAIAAEWMREEKDRIAAAKLSQDLEKEYKTIQRSNIEKGEKAALLAAMEERKRLQADAQAKREREANDVEFAKKVVIEEVESDFKYNEMCKEDIDVAERLQAILDDEAIAARIQEEELSVQAIRRQQMEELSSADEKRAQQLADMLDKEHETTQAKLTEQDMELAAEMQSKIDAKLMEEALDREKHDSALSIKLQIKQFREDHRRMKRCQVLSESIHFPDTQAIATQWETAEAECEDVAGGICLTLLLPHMRDLKVFASSSTKVEIEASRMIYEGDTHANRDNAKYSAEFIIEGKDVNITASDLSFEYSSETSLLHVYIEKVRLEDQLETDDDDSCESKDGVNILDSIRRRIAGFTRIFNSHK